MSNHARIDEDAVHMRLSRSELALLLAWSDFLDARYGLTPEEGALVVRLKHLREALQVTRAALEAEATKEGVKP